MKEEDEEELQKIQEPRSGRHIVTLLAASNFSAQHHFIQHSLEQDSQWIELCT